MSDLSGLTVDRLKAAILDLRRQRDDLLEANNRYLNRARSAEASLANVMAKKPDHFWLAEDGEYGGYCVRDVLDDLGEEGEPLELRSSYAGPTIYAAIKRVSEDETVVVQADTEAGCQALLDA